MKALSTEIEIAAPPEQVWAVLVDLPSYDEWNPFIVEAQGTVEESARLRLRLSPPGGHAMTLKPRITRAARPDALEWLGRLGVPGLFTGRHRFELHATETGTRLVHRETFTGLLVPLLARTLDQKTLRGFEAMNDALKAHAERVALAA